MPGTPIGELKSPSRRAMLAGAIGGLGALAASAIRQPQRAFAHDADDVRLGGTNVATATTYISNTVNSSDVIGGHSTSGIAVSGTSGSGSGVFGSSTSSAGIYGLSSSSYGVYGASNSLTGVGAASDASIHPALRAQATGNSTAVVGDR